MFFFFNDTATTEIYTLSLHDALPILGRRHTWAIASAPRSGDTPNGTTANGGWSYITKSTIRDRKSTRLNSSHGYISYAVFCLKKKKKRERHWPRGLLPGIPGARLALH